MSDGDANFPLRGATEAQLGTAIALCQQDLMWWHGQAITIARFPIDAKVAGIEAVLAKRNRDFLDFAESERWLNSDESVQKLENSAYAERMIPQQLAGIEHSAKLAAVVMLHSACERYFWGLARLAMVAQRVKAFERVAGCKVTVQEVATDDRETVIDNQLEKWWMGLEWVSLPKKWDALVSLIGSPDKLRDGEWHFDRDMLVEFDSIRHDCVHHSGKALAAFDFDRFSEQLARSQWIWNVTLAKSLNAKIPAAIAFGLQK